MKDLVFFLVIFISTPEGKVEAPIKIMPDYQTCMEQGRYWVDKFNDKKPENLHHFFCYRYQISYDIPVSESK